MSQSDFKGLDKYPESRKWLSEITKANTFKAYVSALLRFIEYAGKNPTELIDEAIEDSKKDVRQRENILKQRLIGFHNWMLKDAVRKDGTKGYTPKQASQWTGAIRSFYGTFDLMVRLKGHSKLPKPKVTHKRALLTTSDVKRLVDFTLNLRDKAIILTLFQGGMDVSTCCSINYGQVEKGLNAGESPLKIDLYREKSGTDFYTFIGRNAIDAINNYLTDLQSKGITLGSSDPLFLKDKLSSKERIETQSVQKNLRDIGIRAGLIPKDVKVEGVNPHALRESFGSVMASHAMPTGMVDFLLGHSIGELAEVYQREQADIVREEYAKREIYISINLNGNHLGKEVGDLKDIITKLREENEKTRKEMLSAVIGLQMHVNTLSKELGREAPYEKAEELEKQEEKESEEYDKSAQGIEKETLDKVKKRAEKTH